MKEGLEEKRRRAVKIVDKLRELFPEARISLDYVNEWELYVAVVLSAQCTDKKVNEVTTRLFKKYKTLDDYARADLAEFEQDIRETGFFHNKAKNILAAAVMVRDELGGKLPRTMDGLLKLPGVGRKTANVILSNAYGIAVGIAVDTHVKRLSKLLGLSSHSDPDKIEQDLMKIVPKDEWLHFTHRMIHYGRKYCPARPHDHSNCPLSQVIED
jgi:endonuclease-3